MGKCRVRNYSHKLPARVTDRIHHHFSPAALKHFIVDACPVSPVYDSIFFIDAFGDLNLSRMIDDLPAAVTKIIILAVRGSVDLLHHPGNTRKIHINQQDAGLHISLAGQFHRAA